MNYLKYIITIVVVLVILLGGGGYFYYDKVWKPRVITDLTADFKEYKPIDKLFTAFAYIPLVKYNKGHLKREYVTGIFLFKDKEAIKGYCFRQYEVGIGYDQVTSEIFSKYQDAACQNQSPKMPEPKILSINPVSSQALGNYTRKECDSWDIGSLEERESQQLIQEQLQGNEQWQGIVDNSQKILMSFLRVYCPQSVSEQ